MAIHFQEAWIVINKLIDVTFIQLLLPILKILFPFNNLTMKKLKTILAASTIALLLASCSATTPSMITQNSVGTKVGKSSGTVYLGFLAFGADWGLQTAAKNGGISKIATVDTKLTNVLFIIMTYETIVTGE